MSDAHANANAKNCGCESCRGGTLANEPHLSDVGYIYAVGMIEARFPTIGIEKEFAQATGRAATIDLSDRQSLHAVLTSPKTRYLARQLCYVLSIQGLETYILGPRDQADIQMLVDALGSAAGESSLSVVVGLRGSIAPAGYCNGLSLPTVAITQIYAIDNSSFVRSVPKSGKLEEGPFREAVQEVFAPVMQMADNVGAQDEHRAINYLAARYPGVYAKVAESHAAGSVLAAIDVRPSRLSGSRKIVSVVFSCVNSKTAVAEKFFARVDVTEQFPFLVTGLSPYFDR